MSETEKSSLISTVSQLFLHRIVDTTLFVCTCLLFVSLSLTTWVCLSVGLSIYLSIHPSASLSVSFDQSTYQPTQLFIQSLSIQPSICPSIHLSKYVSTSLSVCLSSYMYLSVWIFRYSSVCLVYPSMCIFLYFLPSDVYSSTATVISLITTAVCEKPNTAKEMLKFITAILEEVSVLVLFDFYLVMHVQQILTFSSPKLLLLFMFVCFLVFQGLTDCIDSRTYTFMLHWLNVHKLSEEFYDVS